jgi:hypothetical protein
MLLIGKGKTGRKIVVFGTGEKSGRSKEAGKSGLGEHLQASGRELEKGGTR